MNACLGDFGIARFYIDSELRTVGDSSSITANGTLGYMAPGIVVWQITSFSKCFAYNYLPLPWLLIWYLFLEYAERSHASTCGDVYSFGIVLLEMLTGKRPTDHMFRNELTIVRFVETNFPDHTLNFLDSRLLDECNDAINQVAPGSISRLTPSATLLLNILV